MGLVILKEFLPGLADRVRILEVLAVHLVDQPHVGAKFSGVDRSALLVAHQWNAIDRADGRITA
jgi:hypothetical protein